jgi:hypothetical protein
MMSVANEYKFLLKTLTFELYLVLLYTKHNYTQIIQNAAYLYGHKRCALQLQKGVTCINSSSAYSHIKLEKKLQKVFLIFS